MLGGNNVDLECKSYLRWWRWQRDLQARMVTTIIELRLLCHHKIHQVRGPIPRFALQKGVRYKSTRPRAIQKKDCFFFVFWHGFISSKYSLSRQSATTSRKYIKGVEIATGNATHLPIVEIHDFLPYVGDDVNHTFTRGDRWVCAVY